jgi:tetraacyldisaccharide 4'-kinase
LQRAWLTRGPLACALLPIAWLFGAASRTRQALYRVGLLKTVRLPVPIVVVGNLIAGGAGKTPTVMAVVELLRSRGFTPGVISRGYGRQGDGVVDVGDDADARVAGDEPLLMRLRLRSPVVVGRDRVAAARELLRLHPSTDIIVSDDGLQHLRLARDAQVLVFDQRGAGNGWLLPAGPLRERLPARVPANSVVLYNSPRPSTALPGSLAMPSLRGAVSLADWWTGLRASQAALDSLRQTPIILYSGMA